MKCLGYSYRVTQPVDLDAIARGYVVRHQFHDAEGTLVGIKWDPYQAPFVYLTRDGAYLPFAASDKQAQSSFANIPWTAWKSQPMGKPVRQTPRMLVEQKPKMLGEFRHEGITVKIILRGKGFIMVGPRTRAEAEACAHRVLRGF